MASEKQLCVRFSGVAGVACVMGAVIFGLLALLSERVSFVGVMAPVAFLGFGIAILTRPYLIVEEDAVIVKALLGPAHHAYGLGPTDVVEFEGKRVVVVNESGRRRLHGITGWLANGRDWAAFRAWAERRHAACVEHGT